MSSSNEQWVEKYRPKKLNEVIGQDEAIEKIKSFLKKFSIGKGKKAIILEGPPGVGKTTLAYVISNEMDSEIFELNASDLRNKRKLQEVLRPAIEQSSLIKKNKIILVDEVDGLSLKDRGGVSELLFLIKITNFPIILTANDIWKKNLSPIRKASEIIKLKELNYKLIKQVLISILRKEKRFLGNDLLTKISINSQGDLRAAINDLQTVFKIDFKNNEELFLRDKKGDIFNIMRTLFHDKPDKITQSFFDSLEMPLDQIFLWIEKNIPKDYSAKEIKKSFDYLSKADIFEKRIYRYNYWRFLVYKQIFLSYGVSLSKSKIKEGFTRYEKPTRILKIWMNNQVTFKKKSIAEKFSKKVHIGKKRAISEFPIIKKIIESNLDIQKELKLDKEEIEYLRNFNQ